MRRASSPAALRRQIATRDTFLERIAHVLETRVSALRAAFAGAQLSEPQQEALDSLSGMSRELGLIARPDAVVAGAPREPLDVVALIRGITSAHADKLSSTGRAFRLTAEGPVRVACDRGDVETMFLELMSNTMKYGRGLITLDIGVAFAFARLTFRDEGPGIPREARRRVLGKFERGAGAPLRTGFGVGLWLLRKIARGYGGEAKLGPGATVVVTLPLAEAGASPRGRRRRSP